MISSGHVIYTCKVSCISLAIHSLQAKTEMDNKRCHSVYKKFGTKQNKNEDHSEIV